MYFGVLGPLVVRTDAGAPVSVPDTKVRTLLLDLLVSRGHPVSADRLIEDLWGDRPPRNATGTLQARISQLRTALDRAEPGSRALVAHGPAGYTLTADVVDSNIFEQLVSAGRLREALDLWRGPAYADVPDHEFARATRDRLEEARLTATEAWLEQSDDALPELTELVRRHPFANDSARCTCAACTEQAATTRPCDRTPSFAHPGRRARRRSRTGAGRAAGGDPPARSVPAAVQLPAPLNDLIGRTETVHDAQGLLTDNRLLTLVGPGGVGKTRLALELGRNHVRRRSPGRTRSTQAGRRTGRAGRRLDLRDDRPTSCRGWSSHCAAGSSCSSSTTASI